MQVEEAPCRDPRKTGAESVAERPLTKYYAEEARRASNEFGVEENKGDTMNGP